jgi:catechol 2,3-dioxygenase-like lactoylglutathione lyase family enzyme
MKVRELGHVVLYVRDLARSKHFYGEILGFPELGVLSRSHRLHDRADPSRAAPHRGGARCDPDPGGRGGMYHFGLKIGDTDDDLRACSRSCRPPGSSARLGRPHVTHSLYLADPDERDRALRSTWTPRTGAPTPSLVLAPTKPLRI